jgi:hypothetical protein
MKIKNSDVRAERLLEINEIFEKNSGDYGRKLFLIENCIYGVDIQPIAIQISKLRFFISLVIDQKIDRDKYNFGVRALPNLETKFIAANTLIGLEKPTEQGDMFRQKYNEKMEEIVRKSHLHFSTDNRQKKLKLQNEYYEAWTDLIKIGKECHMKSTEITKLESFNPFDQNAKADWFDPELMFGLSSKNTSFYSTPFPSAPSPLPSSIQQETGIQQDTGVFDIVIGNPPYVKLQKNAGELGKLYGQKKEGKKTIPSQYQTFDARGDIYFLFYERGYHLLKEHAHLCFITSNKWMRAGYGENTRKFFAEHTNPKLFIDFSGQKIFESATVDVNILLSSKDKNQNKTLACVANKDCVKNILQ